MIFTTKRRTTWATMLLLGAFVLALAGCASDMPAASPASSTRATAEPAPESDFDAEALGPVVALDEMAGHLYTSWQLWQVENYPLAAMHAGHTLGETLPQVEKALDAEPLDALRAA